MPNFDLQRTVKQMDSNHQLSLAFDSENQEIAVGSAGPVNSSVTVSSSSHPDLPVELHSAKVFQLSSLRGPSSTSGRARLVDRILDSIRLYS